MQDYNTIIGTIQMRLNGALPGLSWTGTGLALERLH